MEDNPMTSVNEPQKKKLFDLYMKDATNSFEGWDFSYIESRTSEEPLPWSFASEILPHLRTVSSALDMGTGGGEFLSRLQPFPQKMIATEMFPGNVPIAKKRLEPFGVKVVTYHNKNMLPFENDQFELVINRHEYYPPSQLYRILKRGGYFITQQVGEASLNDLITFFNAPAYQEDGLPEWTLKNAIGQLEDVDFSIIESKEFYPRMRFYDIGALAYYLTAVPFVILDFTIEKYMDKLEKVYDQIINQGYYEVKAHYFLIKSYKE